MSAQAYQLLILGWILGTLVFAAHGVLGYVAHRAMAPRTARLYLQDVFWLELRRDQRRLHRWRVWARLRKDR